MRGPAKNGKGTGILQHLTFSSDSSQRMRKHACGRNDRESAAGRDFRHVHSGKNCSRQDRGEAGHGRIITNSFRRAGKMQSILLAGLVLTCMLRSTPAKKGKGDKKGKIPGCYDANTFQQAVAAARNFAIESRNQVMRCFDPSSEPKCSRPGHEPLRMHRDMLKCGGCGILHQSILPRPV